MGGKRIIGFALLAVGLILVLVSVVTWTRSSAGTTRLLAQKAALEDSLETIRKTAVDNNLRHKALELSISQLPESVRVYGGGQILQQSREYSKKSHILEVQDRNVRVDIGAIDRRVQRERDRALSVSAPFAVAGVILLVAGLMVLRVSAVRREGA